MQAKKIPLTISGKNNENLRPSTQDFLNSNEEKTLAKPSTTTRPQGGRFIRKSKNNKTFTFPPQKTPQPQERSISKTPSESPIINSNLKINQQVQRLKKLPGRPLQQQENDFSGKLGWHLPNIYSGNKSHLLANKIIQNNFNQTWNEEAQPSLTQRSVLNNNYCNNDWIGSNVVTEETSDEQVLSNHKKKKSQNRQMLFKKLMVKITYNYYL